jgi:hypothetical protein
LEDLDADGNVKRGLKKVGWKDMDCIYVIQDRESWQALVHMVISFRAPQNVGNFLTT